MYQAEAGTQCPQTMTFAAVPPIVQHGTTAQKELYVLILNPLAFTFFSHPRLLFHPVVIPASSWATRLICPDYDPENKPAREKKAVSFGMSMTEKQGGSVRAYIILT